MKTNMKAVRSGLAGMATFFFLAASALAQEPVVKDAWVRLLPKEAGALAAYMEIKNPGKSPLVLKEAQSPDFSKVELHKTVVEKGIAKMIPVQSFTIPPQGHLEFKPGGKHIMLIGPKKTFAEGDTTPITLIWEGKENAPLRLEVPLRAQRGDEGKKHHGHGS